MTTRKTRLNTESPTPNSGSDSAPSTPSATRKRLVRKINETGKLDDKDDANKINSPNRPSRPRINRNSLLASTKSPVAVKDRRKVQSTGGASTPDVADTTLPKKRVRRRNSTGRIEVERKQSERLIKKLRSGKSHKSLMSSPNPDKIKVARKRLRLKDKIDDDVKLKKITKPVKVEKIETASDSELLLPIRRRSDSVSKCSDITDTSSYMDVPLVMLKDNDDTFSSSGITVTPSLDAQQEDTSNDIPLKEMIKRELLLNESIKQENSISTTTTPTPNTNDIKTEPQSIPDDDDDIKSIKVEITTNDVDVKDKDKDNVDTIPIEPSKVEVNSILSTDNKKTLEIKEHQLLVDAPILNDSGIGGDADITLQQKPLTLIPSPSPSSSSSSTVPSSTTELPSTIITDDDTKTNIINNTDNNTSSKIVDTIVKRKRVNKKPNDVAKKIVKQKTIRKPNTAAAVTKAKQKVRANAKLKANIKEKQALIQTSVETISIPLRIGIQSVPPPPSTKIPAVHSPPATGTATVQPVAVGKKEKISEKTSTPQAKNKSPSPVLMSVGVSEISVKQFYGQPDFLENNLGIEKDPKLGEIVQEKTKLVSTDDLPALVANLKVPSPITLTPTTTTPIESLSECTSTANSTPRKMNSPETDHDSSQEILPEDRLRIEDSDTAGNSSEGVPTPKKERITVATTTVETIQTHDRTIIEITTTNGVQHHNRMLGGMASVTAQPISVGDSIKCVTVTEQRQQHDRPRTSAATLANINGALDKPLSMEVELIPILPTTAIKPAQNVNSISVEPIESAAPAPTTIVPVTAVLTSLSQDQHRMTEPENKENIILNKVKESMMIDDNKIVVTPIAVASAQQTNECKIDAQSDVKTESQISIIKKESSDQQTAAAVNVINETPELIKQKESLLLTLGLLSHQAAGAAKMQHKHKREEAQKSRKTTSEYTGSLKTIIKLPRPTVNSSGGTGVTGNPAVVTTATAIGNSNQSMSLAQSGSIGNDKKKPVRESLKMTLHKARGKSTTDREQTTNSDGTDTYYTIQNEPTNSSGLIGQGTTTTTTMTISEGANGGQSRKTHYRSHNTSDSVLHSTIDSSESTAIGAIKEKDDEIVIPEKASSFRIHPGKLCQDQCFYCGGKFGLFDTPCHVAQIKSMDRQKKILDNEDKLTVDNCLCDACFRHVDRRANCPSYKKRLSAPSTSNQYMNDGQSDTENGSNNTTIVPKSACQVVECSDGATHSVRRKWFMKMRKSIAKLLNLSAEVTAHGNVSMLWVCDKHYDVISHLMVCALCKRKLLRNHIYYITQDTAKLQQMLTTQGVPVTIGTSLVVCKLCRYYSNILLKPPEPKSPKVVFAKNYRRRLLQFHNIEIVFDSDTDSQPSESPRKNRPNKRSRKSSPDSQKSNDSDVVHKKSAITSAGGQILLDNDVLVGYDPPPMLMDHQPCNESSNQPLLAKILPPYPAAVTSILSKPLMTTAAQTNKSQTLSSHHHHHIVQQQQQPPQQQHQPKDLQTQSKEDISLLRANPNISMRELFPGEEEMGLLVNIPFGSAGLTRTPEGWTKVNTSIQYDEPTRHLWEELQKPYGNQSSFLRHLILLEKYFRQGDLILSENASGNASVYSTSIQHRLQSYDNRGAAAMANFLKSSSSSSRSLSASGGGIINLSTTEHNNSNPPMVTIPKSSQKPRQPSATVTAIQQSIPTAETSATSLLKSNYDSRGRPLRYMPTTSTKDHRSSSSSSSNALTSRKDGKTETVKCTKTAKIPVGLPPELICINTTIANQQSLLSQQQQQQQQQSSSLSLVSQVPQMLQQQTMPLPHHTQPQPIKMSGELDSKKSKHNPTGISVSFSGSNRNLSSSNGNVGLTIGGQQQSNQHTTTSGRNTSTTSTPEVIRLPEVLSISERNESRNWRPTLMPVTAGPPALNGQLYQTADGRKLPNLVQVQSGGKPYLISIHDYNRMCIVRRERLLRDQIQRQQQSGNNSLIAPMTVMQTNQTIADAIQRSSNQHLQAIAQSVLHNLPLSSSSATTTSSSSSSSSTTMTSRHSLLPPPPYSGKLLPNIIDITSKTPAAPLIPPSPILPLNHTSSSSGKIQIPNKILEQNSVIPLTTQSTSASTSTSTSTSNKSSTLDSLLKVRKPSNNLNNSSSSSSLLKPNIHQHHHHHHQQHSKSYGGGGVPTIPAVVCGTSQSLPPFDPNVISITSTPSISAILGMSPMSDASLPSTSAASIREPQSALDILLKSTNNSSSPSINPSSSTPTTTMPTSSMWLWAESLSNNSSNGSTSTSVGSITVTTTSASASAAAAAAAASSSAATTPLSGIDTAAANLLSKIPKSLTVIPQQKSRTSTSITKLSNDDVTIIQ